jgi:uncharacterized membrane protein YjjP (DUF1212 family)
VRRFATRLSLCAFVVCFVGSLSVGMAALVLSALGLALTTDAAVIGGLMAIANGLCLLAVALVLFYYPVAK